MTGSPFLGKQFHLLLQVHQVGVVDSHDWWQFPGPPWLPKLLWGIGTGLGQIVSMFDRDFIHPVTLQMGHQASLIEMPLVSTPPAEMPHLSLLYQHGPVVSLLVKPFLLGLQKCQIIVSEEGGEIARYI